jgi:hypothetical protein
MKPKLDHRSLRHELERMGQEAVPPPSARFASELEERLRAEPRITVVEPSPVPVRPRYRGAWVAVAAAVAAVLALVQPNGGGDVSVTTDDAAATSMPTTTRPAPTTITTVIPATTTVAPAPAPPPVATTATPPPARPTTTTAVPKTTTTTMAAVVGPDPVPITPTTTTTTAPIVRLDLRCAATAGEVGPKVTCTWSGLEHPELGGWRMYRAAGKDAKQLVWSSTDPGVRSYEDTAVTSGSTYQYLVEAVTAEGRTLAKGGITEVACCPA